MKIDIEIIKGLPIEQINMFEDRTVYNVAVETREMAKGLRAFPYLSGELERQEIAEPITGSNKEYSLGAGVDYAMKVYNYDVNNHINWTNPSTEYKWYHTVFDKQKSTIITEAVFKALKEFKK